MLPGGCGRSCAPALRASLAPRNQPVRSGDDPCSGCVPDGSRNGIGRDFVPRGLYYSRLADGGWPAAKFGAGYRADSRWLFVAGDLRWVGPLRRRAVYRVRYRQSARLARQPLGPAIRGSGRRALADYRVTRVGVLGGRTLPPFRPGGWPSAGWPPLGAGRRPGRLLGRGCQERLVAAPQRALRARYHAA